MSVVSMEFRKLIAYRTDFWITFTGQTFIHLTIARALWQSVFEAQQTEVMQGFTLETMTLYYVCIAVGNRVLSGENIGFISREIYEGTFSRYLLYPLSVFQYKTLTYLTNSAFYAIMLIVVYSLYHLVFVPGSLGLTGAGNLLLGTALFFFSAWIYILMAMMVELLALWAENIWSLVVMLRFFTTFFGGGFVPLDFFPEWARQILQYTPFPYLLSLPVKTVLGLTSASEILQGIGILALWGLLFAGIVKMIWTVGQKNYTGVGV